MLDEVSPASSVLNLLRTRCKRLTQRHLLFTNIHRVCDVLKTYPLENLNFLHVLEAAMLWCTSTKVECLTLHYLTRSSTSKNYISHNPQREPRSGRVHRVTSRGDFKDAIKIFHKLDPRFSNVRDLARLSYRVKHPAGDFLPSKCKSPSTKTNSFASHPCIFTNRTFWTQTLHMLVLRSLTEEHLLNWENTVNGVGNSRSGSRPASLRLESHGALANSRDKVTETLSSDAFCCLSFACEVFSIQYRGEAK